MSNQQPPRPAHLENLGAAMRGMSTFDDGQQLHPIIRRAALATPSKWVDALVVSASEDGEITLARLADGTTENRWHHKGLGDVLAPGTPVAFHTVYGVLAIGDTLVSVSAS